MGEASLGPRRLHPVVLGTLALSEAASALADAARDDRRRGAVPR
jgi:hypothetical protein